MAYLKIIENDTEWICPKDATYKVICVAGGPSAPVNTNILTAPNIILGGPTLFGNLISATGSIGGCSYDSTSTNSAPNSYLTGYTLSDYSRPVSGLTTIPIGYGGGGIRILSSHYYFSGPGKINIGFFEIKKDASINCIIGKGGSSNDGKETAGNSGVIVVQEVGPISQDSISSLSVERYTYELYNGSNKIKFGTAISGAEIQLPSVTTIDDDQKFAGWRVNAAGTVYNTKYTVTSDCKLYAYFIAK